MQASLKRFIRRAADEPAARECTDEELLRRFVSVREETAFEAIVRRHGPMVYDVCRAVLSNRADAEDAFQATFLVLVRRAASVRKAASLASWLHGVARHSALKARASVARHGRDGRGEPQHGSAEPDPLVWEELGRVLHEELAQLAARYRGPLVVCYLEGRTQDDAARQLGLSKGTLKRRLERGRDLLRERLVRRGLGPVGVLAAVAWPAAAASPQVVALTVRAATAVSTGAAVDQVVSPSVASLTESVVAAMFLTKLKTVAAGALVASLAAIVAAGMVAAHATTSTPRLARPAAPAPSDERKPEQKAAPVWKVRAAIKGHTDEVLCLTFGVDQLATAGKDGTIRLWEASTGKEQHQCSYPVEDGPMRHMEFTPDGKHILMNFGDQIGYWDVSQKTFPRDPIGGVTPLAGVPGRDGHALLLQSKELNKDVTIWKVPQFAAVGDNKDRLGFGAGAQYFGPFRHRAEVRGAALTQDGTVLGVTTADNTIHLWAAATKKEQAACKGHTEAILALGFSADGKTLASAGTDATVRLWEVATGKEVAVLKGHKGTVRSVAFSPDGATLASGGDDKAVVVWEVKGARRQAVLEGHTDSVLQVAFSRDGRVVGSTGKDKTMRLWEAGR